MLKVSFKWVNDSLNSTRKRVQKLKQKLRGELHMLAWYAAAHHIRMIQKEIQAWTAGTAERKTGRLASSFKVSKVEVTTGGFRAIIESESPYARIHNQGGRISPKSVGYLAIPIAPESRVRRNPRSYADLFVIRSRRGNLLLVRRTRRGLSPKFLLVRQATIRAKRYIEKSERRAQIGIRSIFDQRVAKLLSEI